MLNRLSTQTNRKNTPTAFNSDFSLSHVTSDIKYTFTSRERIYSIFFFLNLTFDDTVSKKIKTIYQEVGAQNYGTLLLVHSSVYIRRTCPLSACAGFK